MTTVLQYLVIAAVIGLVLFGIALLLFGRGEQMAALPARTSPAELPERNISGTDVRKVRFALAVRGYRMSDVDWTLDRLADELDRTREQLAAANPDGNETTELESDVRDTSDDTVADNDGQVALPFPEELESESDEPAASQPDLAEHEPGGSSTGKSGPDQISEDDRQQSDELRVPDERPAADERHEPPPDAKTGA